MSLAWTAADHHPIAQGLPEKHRLASLYPGRSSEQDCSKKLCIVTEMFNFHSLFTIRVQIKTPAGLEIGYYQKCATHSVPDECEFVLGVVVVKIDLTAIP